MLRGEVRLTGGACPNPAALTESRSLSKHLLAFASLMLAMSISAFLRPASAYGSLSIWSSTTAPGLPDSGDGSKYELGLKFKSDVAGYVNGVRFYKASTNTGTHVGHLWTSTGTLLATVTFTNETASGWQQALFSTPVAISANTAYVVSYYAPNGHYSNDHSYFGTSYNNPPLHALADGTSGPNGAYFYNGMGFPTGGYLRSNYWVDVAFTPATSTTNSIWSNSAIPGTVDSGDGNQYELGLKFTSDVSGYINGVRFYKASSNTGTHVGHLWDSQGNLLGSVTFTGETASGWQTASFSSPILIQPNTPYLVSYSDPAGHYSVNDGYFTNQYDNAPLHAVMYSKSRPNGVYSITPGSVPNFDSFNENYWVDVVFLPSATSNSGGNATPAISSVSPSSNPAAGGTVVNIVGSNFQSGASVSFGGTNSTAVTFISATQLNAIAPAHAAGTVNIVVTNPGGASATLSASFTYTSAPTIGSVSPSSGPDAGGTTVTILGSGFESGAIVKFGTILAASATILSPTQIQAVTPAETAATVSVSVQNPDPATTTMTSAYTFYTAVSAPTVSSISPNSNIPAGGATVTITGSNFTNGATVKFGNTASSLVTLVSSTQLNAVVPPGNASTTVNLTVTNPNGQAATLTNGFRYGQVLFSDDFESGNFNKWNTVLHNGGASTSVCSTIAHSGTHAACQYYTLPADPAGTNRDNDIWMEKNFGPGLNHLFVRGYVYLPNPLPGSDTSGTVQRKLFYMWDSNAQGQQLGTYFCVLTTFNLQLATNCGSGPYLHYGASLQYNTWTSVEMEVKVNTPNQSDGYFNVWVNGQLALSVYNVDVRNDAGQPEGTTGLGVFAIGQQIDTGETGSISENRYWDDVVISDAYIGP